MADDPNKTVFATITPQVNAAGVSPGVAEVTQKLQPLIRSAKEAADGLGALDRSFSGENVAKAVDRLRKRFDEGYREQQKYTQAVAQFQRLIDQFDSAGQVQMLENINNAFKRLPASMKLSTDAIGQLTRRTSEGLHEIQADALVAAQALQKVAQAASNPRISESALRAAARATAAERFAPEAEADRFQRGVNMASGIDPFQAQRDLNARKKFWEDFEAIEVAGRARIAALNAAEVRRVQNRPMPAVDYAAEFERMLGPELDARRAAAQQYALALNPAALATQRLAERTAELNKMFNQGDLSAKELKLALADVKREQDALNAVPPNPKVVELEKLISSYGRLQTEIQELVRAEKLLQQAQANRVIAANAPAGREALGSIQARLAELRAEASGAAEKDRQAQAAQRLADQYDRTGAAMRRLRDDEVALGAALSKGQIKLEQYEASLKGLQAAKAQLSAGTNQLSQSLTNLGTQGENLYQRNLILRSGFINVFQSIAAGQGVLSTLFIQSTQVVGAFGNLNMTVLAVGAGIAVAAGAVIGLGAAIARTGDAAVMAQGRLIAFMDDTERALGVYARFQALGETTGVQATESAGVFSRLLIGAEQIGATTAQTERLLETFQKLGIIGSATTQELVAGMRQFTQALGKGKLDGDEFRSILENLPEVVRLMGRNMGKSTEELREMGRLGQLTSRLVFDALLRGSEEVDQRFSRLPQTMSRAFAQMQVSLAGVWTELDRLTGLSTRLAEILAGVAGRLQEFRRWLISVRDPNDTANNVGTAENAVTQTEALKRALEERYRVLQAAQEREQALLRQNEGARPALRRTPAAVAALQANVDARAAELRSLDREIAETRTRLTEARATVEAAQNADLPRRSAEADRASDEANAADYSAQQRAAAQATQARLEQLEELRRKMGGAYEIERRYQEDIAVIEAARVARQAESLRIESQLEALRARGLEGSQAFNELIARRVAGTRELDRIERDAAKRTENYQKELQGLNAPQERADARRAAADARALQSFNRGQNAAIAREEAAFRRQVTVRERAERKLAEIAARQERRDERAAARQADRDAKEVLRTELRINAVTRRANTVAAQQEAADARDALAGERRIQRVISRANRVAESEAERQRRAEERAARAAARTGRTAATRAAREVERLETSIERASTRGENQGASAEIQSYVAISAAVENYIERVSTAAIDTDLLNDALDAQADALDNLTARYEVQFAQIEQTSVELETQNRIRQLETLGTRAARDEIDSLVLTRALESIELQRSETLRKLNNDLISEEGDARERVLGLIRDANAAYDRQVAATRAPENQRSFQDGLDSQRRAIDNAVKESGDFFFNYFTGRSQDIGEVFGNAIKRGLSDALAEEVLRPIISPIVRTVVGPGSLTEAAFPGGIGSALGLTGANSPLSSLGSIGSMFTRVRGGIDSFGASALPSWFAPSTGISAGGLAGPGGLAALEAGGVGAAGGTAGSVGSLTGALGMGAAGVGAGLFLGNMLAGDSKARQTNSMIGTGAGLAAGIALAPATGGLSLLLGPALGGAGGGLIGPGKGFAGGDAIVESNDQGQLVLARTVGKNFDQAGLGAQVEGQLGQLNATLSALGLRFGAGTSAAVGGGESRNPQTLTGALQHWGARLMSDNAMVNQAVQGRDFEDALKAAEWVKSVYEPLVRASDATRTLANALEDSRKPFDEAIAKAREYGLSVVEIETLREKASAKIERENFRAIQDNDLELWSRAAGGNRLRQLQEASTAFNIRAQRQSDDLEENLAARGVTGDWAAAIFQRLRDALATESAELAQAWTDFYRARREQTEEMSLRIMRGQANLSGNANQAMAADLFAFDSGAQGQVADLQTNLKNLGYTASEVAAEVGRLTYAHMLEKQAIIEAYEARRREVAKSLDDRLFATTNDSTTVEGALAAFDRRAREEREDAAKLGLANMVQLERTLAAERLEIIENFGKQSAQALRDAGKTIRQFLDELRSGPSSSASAQDRLASAKTQFGTDLALARSGDTEALARITGTASNLLQAGKDNFASGAGFQQLLTFVEQSLATIPATRSYDDQILEELRKLGGAVNVNVSLEVIRAITETLNLISEADKAKLVQSQTVLRQVEERLGRMLTQTELVSLIQGGPVRQLVEQTLGRVLTQTERDGLLVSASITRRVEQILGRDLTPAEKALIVLPATVPRTVTQTVQNPTGTLVNPGTVVRNVTQAVETTETVRISRSIDDKLSAQMYVQAAFLSEILRASLATAANTAQIAIGQGRPGITNFNDPAKAEFYFRFRANANVALKRLNDPGYLGFGDLRSDQSQMFAQGGAFTNGIVDKPTAFPIGVMGEDGSEAILPLGRTSSGDLGVYAAGGMGNGESLRALMSIRDELVQLRQEVRDLRGDTQEQTGIVAEAGDAAMKGQATVASLLNEVASNAVRERARPLK